MTHQHTSVLPKLQQWLADGESWIGGFENHDLGHPEIGRRVLFVFDDSQWEDAKLGSTRSPDHAEIGLGWRYVLGLKTRDAEEAHRWLSRQEPGKAQDSSR